MNAISLLRMIYEWDGDLFSGETQSIIVERDNEVRF
jgi:hypothetical protein